MLTIYSADGAQKYPLDVPGATFYITHVYGGLDTLTFNISPNHELYPMISEEVTVEYDDILYKIKNINERETACTVSSTIDLDETKANAYKVYRSETRTLRDVLQEQLPGWTLDGVDLVSIRRTIELEKCNGYDVVMQASKTYNVAYEWHNKEQRVRILKPENVQPSGEYITDELNLRKLTFKGSSKSFATRIYPYGKNGLTIADVNGGLTYLENHTYSNQVISTVWADERYTDPISLRDDAIERLKGLAVPVRSYECDVVDLAKIHNDYSDLSMKLYDIVTLIDRRRGTRIDHRIVEYKEYPYNPEKNVVTLSSVAEKITTKIDKIEVKFNDEVKVDREKINEIRRDVDTNSARIAETYTKGETDTRIESLVQQSADSITTTVRKEISAALLDNLVINGYGEYLNNTNFPGATFTRGDCPDGIYGYFNGTGSTDFIPFDRNAIYDYSYYCRLHEGKSGASYFSIAPMDVDGNVIGFSNVLYDNTNLFYLAQDLKKGDTVVHFTDLTHWDTTTANDYYRSFLMFGYTDSTGYTYPDGTYSRHSYIQIYADGSSVDKTAKTITLKSAWAGKNFAAGTCVGQTRAGDGYCYYGQKGTISYTDWKHWTGKFYAGTVGGKLTGESARLSYAKSIQVIQFNNVADYCGICIKKANTLDPRVTTAETQITQNAEAISQRATKTEVQTVKASADAANSKIDGLQIGGRNLLLKSGVPATTAAYHVNTYYFGSTKPVSGETYTLSLKGTLHAEKSYLRVFNSGGSVSLCSLTKEYLDKDGVYRATFPWKITQGNVTVDNSHIQIYAIPESVTGVESTIEWIKLEKGNKATDWTPAPEDVQTEITETKSALETQINQTAEQIQLEAEKTYTTKKDLSEDVQKLQASINANAAAITNTVSAEQYNKDWDSGVSGNKLSSILQQTAQNYTLYFSQMAAGLLDDAAETAQKIVDGAIEGVATFFEFTANGLTIGKSDSPFKAQFDNERLAFLQNGQAITWISNSIFHALGMESEGPLTMTNSKVAGKWVMDADATGRLNIYWRN